MAQVDDDSGSLTDMDSRHSLLSSPPDSIADDRKVCSPTCIKIMTNTDYRKQLWSLRSAAQQAEATWNAELEKTISERLKAVNGIRRLHAGMIVHIRIQLVLMRLLKDFTL